MLALLVEPDIEVAVTLATFAAERGYEVQQARTAADAQAVLSARTPAIAFLHVDIAEPEDLAALMAFRRAAPGVPVVILSERSDPDAVAIALSHGASNVIQRPLDADEVRFVLDCFYRFGQAQTGATAAFTLGERRATELSFLARPGVLSPVIAFLTDELAGHFPGHDEKIADVRLALYEAFANAMEHGNLGISFEEKTKAMETPSGIRSLIQRRMADPDFKDREVFVRAEYDTDSVTYTVRDEGDGFDYRRRLSQPVAKTTALHGRGLKIIEHYMDTMDWNDAGNELRMGKKITGSTPTRPTGDGTA